MDRISPEHGPALLEFGAKLVRNLGDQAYRGALLMPGGGSGHKNQLPNLQIGMVHYVDGGGQPFVPGRLKVIEPRQTEHGCISFRHLPYQPSEDIRISQGTAQIMYRSSTFIARECLRSLAATLRATPQLPVSMVWAKGMDYGFRDLHASIYRPAETPEGRMRALLALQGFSFDPNGSIRIDAPYDPPYSDLPFVVQYSFGDPISIK